MTHAVKDDYNMEKNPMFFSCKEKEDIKHGFLLFHLYKCKRKDIKIYKVDELDIKDFKEYYVKGKVRQLST